MIRPASRVTLYVLFVSLGFLLHRRLIDYRSGHRFDEATVSFPAAKFETDEYRKAAGYAETLDFFLDQHSPDQDQLRFLLAHWARVDPVKAMAALDRSFLLINDPEHCLSIMLHKTPLAEAEKVIEALLKTPRLRNAALARRDSSWPDGVERLLGDLTRADADRAWHLARSLPPGGMRGHLSGRVVEALSKQDFPRITALAIQWLGESPPGEDRERLMDALERQGQRYFEPQDFAIWKDRIRDSLRMSGGR